MKRLSFISLVVGGLMCCSTGKANITNVDYADDGDGAIVCPVYTWSGSATWVGCQIAGDQYWGPAHVVGTIATDSASDPTLTLSSAINNDTSFTWTAYDVNVYMSSTFTLSDVSVTTPGDWTVTSALQPVLVNSPLGAYEAQIVFTGGTPVTVGNDLDFSYA